MFPQPPRRGHGEMHEHGRFLHGASWFSPYRGTILRNRDPIAQIAHNPCFGCRIGLNAVTMRIHRDSLILATLGLSRPWALPAA